jgi:hypothetical protein
MYASEVSWQHAYLAVRKEIQHALTAAELLTEFARIVAGRREHRVKLPWPKDGRITPVRDSLLGVWLANEKMSGRAFNWQCEVREISS